MHIAPPSPSHPSLGTVDHPEHAKIKAHRRLAALLIAKGLIDDLVLNTVDMHRRNEVLSRKVGQERTEAIEICLHCSSLGDKYGWRR